MRHRRARRAAARAGDRRARTTDRAQLAELTARRLELTRRILPEDGGTARIAKLGQEVGDVGDLIRRADAAAEHRDKEVFARTRAAPGADKASAPTAETA